MNNIDLYLFNLIHGLAGESTYLDFFARFSAQYLLYFAVLGFFLWAAFTHDEVLKQIRLSVGLLALASGIFARFILAEILRIFLPRPRPFVFFNFPSLVREFATLNSFPSGHAIFFFAFATIVFFHSRKLGG
ncbi:MAG: phosphatase PAP2 family protein, partial [Parcubacteria group bacterium]|nr:phosphatase PAP2 family protein [Parcubacteria group bacterium]